LETKCKAATAYGDLLVTIGAKFYLDFLSKFGAPPYSADEGEHWSGNDFCVLKSARSWCPEKSRKLLRLFCVLRFPDGRGGA